MGHNGATDRYTAIVFSDARSKREAPALAKDTPSTFRCEKADSIRQLYT